MNFQHSWFLGLDIGQARSHSALAVIERSLKPRVLSGMGAKTPAISPFPPHFYDLRHMRRFPLDTAYSTVIASVRELLRNPILANSATLIVDSTGVGSPVVEMIRNHPLKASLIPIVITSGYQSGQTSGAYTVPKRDLISNLVTALETASLRIPEKLPQRNLLFEEFANFRTSLSRSGNPTFSAISGEQDDLILALALALWWARARGPIGEQSHGPLL